MPNIIWVGHRGYPECYPENTLRGLEAALQLGAQALELDIQVTRDGELVVFHDADLTRVTGSPGHLIDFDWAELKQISAHEPTRFNQIYFPTYIAHLKEVVTLCGSFPNVTLFVEIKHDIFEQMSRGDLIKKLCDILQPIQAQCVIISFDLYVLRMLQQQANSRECKTRVGWVITAYDALSHARLQSQPVDFVISNIDKLPPLPEQPWQGPWQWFVYDVVTEAQTQACLARGIYWLETWDIKRMLSLYPP